MKILHITEDYSKSSGGLRTAVKNLHEELLNYGWSSIILTAQNDTYDDTAQVIKGENKWLYSEKWKSNMQKLFEDNSFDVLHVHGVWMFPQYFAALFANKNKIPWVFSPHGMYEPWLWTQGTLKKKIYFHLFAKKVFKKANYFHAITISEKDNLKKLFGNINIKTIPNLALDLKTDIIANEKDEKFLLFVGRLDKKKGIELLIEAFAAIKDSNFKLKIVGETNFYKRNLDEIVEKLNLSQSVEFLGYVDGIAKQILYKRAFFLVYPSHSEAIGLVNLEAAMQSTPVLTTYETGLPQAWNNHGGILIHPNLQQLKEKLLIISSMTWQQRNDMGINLRKFVIENFSWKKRMSDWLSLYSSLK
ncbi:glycosyltransferase [Aegicerativicinus sediminis]|uniref:glycosyltransferase n=1 Tax=Aegicerativicinus sediminis TaxID=2893202 RepID=UPI001E47C14A|nr:glycosyltransferase [Aegicerativicinus sediminis]